MADDINPSTVAHAPAVRTRSHRFEVRVTAGPDAGASVVVSQRSAGRVLVGTSESCALRLSDRRVSRRHLALDAVDGALRVTDLGSTNGTIVNGLRAADLFCQGGEIVVIGDTALRIDVNRANPETPDIRMAFGPLVGASLAMRRLYRTCDALARSRSVLLIEGEPGTGKLALAGALHTVSTADGPFVVVEGAELTVEALAKDAKTLLTAARSGTLLVHEIAAAPLESQPSLAALVAEALTREVRFVSTTCKNLDAAVEAGMLREELARELASRIELPPLRERRGDIALLVEHFCNRLGVTSAVIPPKKLAALNRHDFAGNVRELETTVTHLVAGTHPPLDGGRAADITPEALGLEVSYRDLLVAGLPFADAKQQLLDRFSTAYVRQAVAAHGGHVAGAAAASGLAPRYFNLLRARGRTSGDDES